MIGTTNLERILRKVLEEEIRKELTSGDPAKAMAQIKALELYQTLIIEQTLTIPVDAGTYDYIMEPDVGKIWYLGYAELRTSANTSADLYITSTDGGGEAFIFSVGTNSSNSKDFKFDYGANGRCVKLRARFTNAGTGTENQTLIIRGIETLRV